MKKLLLSAAVIAAGFTANSQTFFGPETFDTEIPATWTIYDLDNLPSSNGQAAWASWAHYATLETATSSSWYDGFAGPTDDWLVTPQISVPASGTNNLTFWGASHESAYLETYEILLSTTGNNTGDFTVTLLTVTDEEIEANGGTNHSIDLSAYNGQNIYIAFHHISNDKSLLHIDNVECATLAGNDLEVTDISVDNRIEGNKTFTVEVTNNGSNTVSAFDLDWQFDGSGVTTENITGLSLTTGQTYDVMINVGTVNAGLAKNFDANITTSDDVNGNNQLDDDFDFFVPIPQFTGNSSTGTPYDLHAALASGQAIVLDFMATWCTPCQNSTPELSQFIENNGSGTGNVESYAISVEPTDDAAALNAINWNGGYYAYPKFPYDNTSYTTSTAFQYGYYNTDHALGSGGIPFFLMICPNKTDPGNSTIVQSDVGFSSGMFSAYQTALDGCPSADAGQGGGGSGLIESSAISELNVFPNPAQTETNVQFNVNYASNVSIEVVNMLGQKVYTNNMGTLSGFQTLNIGTADLEGGTYLININVGGDIISERLTVVR